jgi:hypothetical protein
VPESGDVGILAGYLIYFLSGKSDKAKINGEGAPLIYSSPYYYDEIKTSPDSGTANERTSQAEQFTP